MPEVEDIAEPAARASTEVQPFAGATGPAVGDGGGGRDRDGVRDREPPPTYDGQDPEGTFKTFEKNVRLWEWETDIPRRKQGAKLLRGLTGMAQLAVENMEFEEIATEDGVRNVMKRLKEFFLPHLEVSLPRAFENAVYGRPRQAIYRQASLTEAQDQRLLTWCDGKYDKASIVKALRKLDKVIREKSGKSSYFNEDAEVPEEEAYMFDDDDDENYVFVADGDLDQVFTEEEMMAALASYKEVRESLREQRNNRGYYPKGKGYGGKMSMKGKGKNRVHVEQLKLRTRCWRCGALGHISRECSAPVPEKNKGSVGTSSNGPSSTASQKSGFFVIADAEGGQGKSVFPVWHEPDVSESHWWLRQFVEERRRNEACSSDRHVQSERAYKSALTEGFCGITTRSAHGVVDTAAEGGLVGSKALERLSAELAAHGLTCKWTPKKSSAKGVGGQAKVLGVVLIPLGIGGLNGVLEATVVEGDVPLLLPVRMMKQLRAIVDFSKGIFCISNESIEVPMFDLPSGHVTIEIMNFAATGFEVSDPDAPCSTRDFQLHVSSRAMLAQLTINKCAAPPSSVLEDHSLPWFGEHVEPGAAADGRAACWRVVMDKIVTIMQFVDQQLAVQEWFPGSSGLLVRPTPLSKEQETIEDVYAQLIVGAETLPPLKSKEQPTAAASSCIHPKNALRGGGNKSASYIYCKNCLSRWNSPLTAAEIHAHLKDQKKKGPLSQKKELPKDLRQMEDTEMLEPPYGEEAMPSAMQKQETDQLYAMQHQMRAAQEELWRELQAQRQEAKEKEMVHQKALLTMHQEKEALEHQLNQLQAQEAMSKVKRCHCGVAAEKLVVKKEGPRQGRKFWKCTQRECQYFEWVPRTPSQRAERIFAGHVSEDGRTDERAVIPHEEQESEDRESDPCRKQISGGGDTRLSEEMWLYATAVKGQRTLNRILRGHDQHFAGPGMCYEVEIEEGNWKAMSGLISLQEGMSVRVKTSLRQRAAVENYFGMEKETQLSRAQRRMLNRAFEAITPRVSEVYSPPRVVAEAQKQGLTAGTSFDISEGWDLSKPEMRRQMWKRLKEEDPLLVVLSPPCVGFSILQELNLPKMSWHAAVMLISTGLDHLELAMLIAK
eukprot:s2098_g4.t1